jgi:hypothetical protein
MNWVKSMLSDGGDIVSSKRVITFLAFLLCAAAFVGNTWFGYKVDSNLFNSLMYIVIAGLGFTASEKFAQNKEK